MSNSTSPPRRGYSNYYANATNTDRRSSRATRLSPNGERSSAILSSPLRCWTVTYTIATSSTSRAKATACDPGTKVRPPARAKKLLGWVRLNPAKLGPPYPGAHTIRWRPNRRDNGGGTVQFPALTNVIRRWVREWSPSSPGAENVSCVNQ